MKKFKYYYWWDSERSPIAYVEADDFNDAKEKIKNSEHWTNDGDLQEVKEFKQPDPIPVI